MVMKLRVFSAVLIVLPQNTHEKQSCIEAQLCKYGKNNEPRERRSHLVPAIKAAAPLCLCRVSSARRLDSNPHEENETETRKTCLLFIFSGIICIWPRVMAREETEKCSMRDTGMRSSNANPTFEKEMTRTNCNIWECCI